MGQVQIIISFSLSLSGAPFLDLKLTKLTMTLASTL